ncbi:hypothetical protein PC128_g1725 [Phytophthora cactorum]|nr:hypothetical protein PC128_g1725 [Phytophthora cactorum]
MKYFLKLENAMEAAQEATDSDLKQSIEGKVRDIQAHERYTLSNGTPGTSNTKNERALVASGPPVQRNQKPNGSDVCSYCDRPRHNIRQCRGLQKDLRDGRVKVGTVLPANFAFKGNSKRYHPYRNSRNWNQGRNGNDTRGGNNHRNKNNGGSAKGNQGKNGKNHSRNQGNSRPFDSDDDASSDNNRNVFRQARQNLDPTWTIDSGCTRHVTHDSQWFRDIATSGGSITVGGNNQIPIDGIGRIVLTVVDAKGNKKKLILQGALYVPQLQFCLLSIPAAVKQDYRFSFDRKHFVVQTNQRFKFMAPMAANTDLYQFQAQPAVKTTALVVSGPSHQWTRRRCVCRP